MTRRAGRAWLLAAALLAAGPSARAGDLSPEEEKWVLALLKALDANSPNVRKGAEEALARMGLDALPAIADGLPQVKSGAAQKGLRRALDGMGRDVVVASIEKRKQGLAKAAAKKWDDLLSLLGGAPGAGAGGGVPVAPARLDPPALAPLAAEHAVGDLLPEALVRGKHGARAELGTLRVDADGDGAQETTVASGSPQVVEVGTGPRRPVLLREKRGAWTACSASTLRGGAGSAAIELLDADLDGRFDGAGDFVRVGDGAFGPVGASRRVAIEDATYAWTLRAEGAGSVVELVPEPTMPGADASAVQGLATLNRIRQALGLAPARLDASRCAACRKHAAYLQANAGTPETAGLGAHREIEGKPGYSPEGAAAGGNAAISLGGDAGRAMDSFFLTMLHRVELLGPAERAVGIASAPGGRGASTLLWGDDPSVGDAAAPLVVPGPGQRRVPTRGSGEEPVPEDPPGWYDQPRGFPVSVHHAGMGLSGVTIRLVEEGGAEVAGRLWNDEKPVRRGHAAQTAFFMPAAPLSPRGGYVVEVQALRRGAPVLWIWSFRTD